MKKVYFLGLALMFIGTQSFAQKTSNMYSFGLKNYKKADPRWRTNTPTNSNQDRTPGATIITDDFSNPANWTTTADANGNAWTIETSTPANVTTYMSTMASTTNSNGFGCYNGIDDLIAGTVTPVDAQLEMVNGFDCSAAPGVLMEFEQMYRPFNTDVVYVEVTNDNWATNTQYQINSDYTSVNSPTIQTLELLDISGAAAGSANVKVRFHFEELGADPSYGSGYGWSVDDIRIYEAWTYDVSHDNGYVGDIFNDWEYTDVPTSQTGMLTCQSYISSFGVQVPTNLALEVTVFDGSMAQIYTETGGSLSAAPLTLGDVDTITFTTALDLSTLGVGTYTVQMVTVYDETDDVLTNDTIIRTFNITDNFYSHVDYDQGANFQDNGVDGYQFGAAFGMVADDEIHGVDVYIGPGSDVGQEIQVWVYEWPDLTADPVNPTGPYIFDVTNGMLDSWVTLNFHQRKYDTYTPYTLSGGMVYVPMIEVYQGNTFEYAANPLDADFSSRYISDAGDWFWDGDEPFIGLNFDIALAIDGEENNNFNIGQNYPNPFDNNSTINYSLEEASNVTITFTDLSGKVVKTVNQGTQAAGAYTLDVNSADFAEGVYFYTFTIGDVQVTRKMTVTK